MANLEKLSNDQLKNQIANYERLLRTTDPLYGQLVQELAKRTGGDLKLEKSLEHLANAARQQRFTSYGALASASGVEWTKARHRMDGANGHLDQLLSVCRSRGLPLLPSICVNKNNINSGELDEHSLQGFVKGAERLGYTITDWKEFLHSCQQECFKWGQSYQGSS